MKHWKLTGHRITRTIKQTFDVGTSEIDLKVHVCGLVNIILQQVQIKFSSRNVMQVMNRDTAFGHRRKHTFMT